MLLMRPVQTWHPIGHAERLAAELSALDADGWTYRVIPSPDGTRGRVAVHDETGEYLGDL